MEAYRDQYATLFHNGRHVAVIGISVDPDTMLADWAREKDFPIVFASDSGGAVGRLYQDFDPKSHLDRRALYVIAPDGRISYATPNFQVLSPQAYTDLAAVVERVAPAAAGAAGGGR